MFLRRRNSRSWWRNRIILAIVIGLTLNSAGTFVWRQRIVIFQETIFGGGGGGTTTGDGESIAATAVDGDDHGNNIASSSKLTVDSSNTRPRSIATIPSNTTLTIAVRLRGQMGNILSGIAFGMGVQLWIRDRYDIHNNNIHIRLLPDQKYIGARKKVLQCFPKLKELFNEPLQPPNKLSSQYKRIHTDFTTRYKQQTKLVIDALLQRKRKSSSTTTDGDVEIATAAAKEEANKI